MCQNKTDSQTPLSGAWAKVQGQATAQLQLSNQSPMMCQFGISSIVTPLAFGALFRINISKLSGGEFTTFSRNVVFAEQRKCRTGLQTIQPNLRQNFSMWEDARARPAYQLTHKPQLVLEGLRFSTVRSPPFARRFYWTPPTSCPAGFQ